MVEKQISVSVNPGDELFFCDSVAIMHSPAKFVIDLKQTSPRIDQIDNRTQQTLIVRHNAVIMDPELAKTFLQLLETNVKNYEKQFGRIKLPQAQKEQAKSVVSSETADSTRYIG